jgi:hypothetical protein
LALIAEELGDRVGFFTILFDFERDRDSAIQITENENASFLTVNFSDSVAQAFRQHITASVIPQAFIIDGDGNIIENVIGGDADVYREAIINALLAG